MRITNFLKRVLLLDAASCLGMGAGLLIGANGLAAPLGLSAGLLGGAGLLLLPLGLFIGWLGLRSEAPAALVWLVILGNLGWVGESLLVAFGQPGVTTLGSAFVATQAAAVLGLALLEYAGVRAVRTMA
jgi:hypothetical protein